MKKKEIGNAKLHDCVRSSRRVSLAGEVHLMEIHESASRHELDQMLMNRRNQYQIQTCHLLIFQRLNFCSESFKTKVLLYCSSRLLQRFDFIDGPPISQSETQQPSQQTKSAIQLEKKTEKRFRPSGHRVFFVGAQTESETHNNRREKSPPRQRDSGSSDHWEPRRAGKLAKAMTASDSSRFTALLFAFVLFSSQVSLCGTEGVRVDCTATNNTVCNERSEGLESGEKAAIIVSILAFAILIAAALYYMYVRRRKMRSRNLTPAQTNGNPAEVEFLPVKDLHLHLPDIAAILGWKDMKDVAMRSGISATAIDSCKLDHPNNSEEQTLQLLVKWVEKQGMGASKDLIEILQKSDKHFKAGKVKEILQNDSTATSNNPV
ncbi:hypothetical protein F2P81_020317 [Scophthalmus maximus]|uniref:Death domain-containing protein n=1 Tax=Scophthalmus maximus TaxID=52904 RepID=A0A6A4RXM0_SCOMX|nr:hypothetical protein F2P81_020317 [Scophthalmus maximus]